MLGGGNPTAADSKFSFLLAALHFLHNKYLKQDSIINCIRTFKTCTNTKVYLVTYLPDFIKKYLKVLVTNIQK